MAIVPFFSYCCNTGGLPSAPTNFIGAINGQKIFLYVVVGIGVSTTGGGVTIGLFVGVGLGCG